MSSGWKISVSRTKLANHCPRKYVIAEKYKKNVYSFYMFGPPIGMTVHWILDQFAKNVTSSEKFLDLIITEGIEKSFEKGIYRIFQQKVETLNFEYWTEESVNLVWSLIQSAIQEIINILKKFKLEELSEKQHLRNIISKFFLATEWSFKIPLELTNKEKITVTGRLDWLTIDPETGEAVIWDFKTGSTYNYEIDIQQVSLYAYAIKEKLGVETKAVLFYLTSTGVEKRKIPSKTVKDIQMVLIPNLERVKRWHLGTEEPPPTSDKETCEWCKVASFCRKTYGKNPFVPTMGIRWKNLILKNIKYPVKDEQSSASGNNTNLILGKILNQKDELLIHPMVFNKHAAILGASGSGKTYLGKKIIEESLLRGFSALLIDPQGDLCSMVMPEDPKSEYSAQLTKIKKKIYTPGSTKGIKLSINPLENPSIDHLSDADYRNAILDNTSSLILLIIGMDLKKLPPEKAFLEAIILDSWNKKEILSFATLASKVEQTVRVRSVTTGEFVPSESLVSNTNKSKLARNLNKVAVGTEGAFFIGGETLNLTEFVNSPSLSIINLASVGTDIIRRQLVVSWILRQVYDWLLTNPQKSQDQIRFFLYIDEIADFLPPHPFNPPSKKMLMLLFRQARKYGVSCILATQSPAAIDYKALDNVSTLFIGKIPTAQSRRKLQSYLEPYGDQLAIRLLKHTQKAKVGEFIMTGVGDPIEFKTNILLSKHLTLSLDDVEKLKINGKLN